MPDYHSRVGVTSRLRMRGHDYAAPASYLITNCTEQRPCVFCTVIDGDLAPSPAGVIVDSWRHYLPARIASVELDATIVMPSHVHAGVHLGTDPDLELVPSLGKGVRWFTRRSTCDTPSAPGPKGGLDSPAGCGSRGIAIAAFAMNAGWSGPGNT